MSACGGRLPEPGEADEDEEDEPDEDDEAEADEVEAGCLGRVAPTAQRLDHLDSSPTPAVLTARTWNSYRLPVSELYSLVSMRPLLVHGVAVPFWRVRI